VPELGTDPRYATNSARIGNRVELIERLASILKTRSRDEWLRDLEAAGVPCGPINDISQVFEDPQVKVRELRRDIAHPLGVMVPTTASPLRLSETPVRYRMAPPLLGEHTYEVLRDLLQMDDAKIARVRAAADTAAK
jgi:crotonobetainyl-CoA:carnitine CoA-transferase CaiB-like acyl-CoA transferase